MRVVLLWCCLVLVSAAERPLTWAQPVTVEGVENFYRLTPGLYRCAQPDGPAMVHLKAFGITTVVNLRVLHGDADEVAGTDLHREELAVQPWHIEDEDVVRVLRITADPTKAPVLIHCHHGADRTGLMCAMYRIVIQGWAKDDAIREMTEGGYGFWAGWTNIVRYVREVEVERIRAAVNAP